MSMWTNNIVTFYGADEDLKKVAERLYSPGVTSEEDNCFDFNKIIPFPNELSYIHSSRFNSGKKMIHGRLLISLQLTRWVFHLAEYRYAQPSPPSLVPADKGSYNLRLPPPKK